VWGCVGGVGGVGGVGCVGGVWAVWAVWGCGVTPYVRHSTDCTCCDFGHLRFNLTKGFRFCQRQGRTQQITT
jgi:hypothetical protein